MAADSWKKSKQNTEAYLDALENETIANCGSRFETLTSIQNKVKRLKQNCIRIRLLWIPISFAKNMSGHNLSPMESLASCFVRMIAEFDRALLNRELLRRR